MPARIVGVLLLLVAQAAALSAAAQGWMVEREVAADLFVSPTSILPRQACPSEVGRPSTGAQVQLLISSEMARRNEPTVSFIVRLDTKTAYVLHHGSSTYSGFPFPPKTKLLETSFRASMGADADEFFGYQLEGTAHQKSRQVDQRDMVVRTGVVGNRLGRHLDVEAHLLLEPAAAAAAYAVEGFAQSVRGAGEQWLALLGDGDGIPLTLSEAVHQPSVKVKYVEAFSRLEKIVVDPGLFSPPGQYKKVEHVPECFFVQ